MQNITNSQSAYQILKSHFKNDVEEVWVCALNSQLQIINFSLIFRGTVNSCPFHLRDILRYALLNNAVSIIVAHNHPSQNLEPSQSDIVNTQKLIKAAALVEVQVIDHLIISQDSYFSFADNGYVKSPLLRAAPARIR